MSVQKNEVTSIIQDSTNNPVEAVGELPIEDRATLLWLTGEDSEAGPPNEQDLSALQAVLSDLGVELPANQFLKRFTPYLLTLQEQFAVIAERRGGIITLGKIGMALFVVPLLRSSILGGTPSKAPDTLEPRLPDESKYDVTKYLGIDPESLKYPYSPTVQQEPIPGKTTIVSFGQVHPTGDIFSNIRYRDTIAASQESIRDMLRASKIEHVFDEGVTTQYLHVLKQIRTRAAELDAVIKSGDLSAGWDALYTAYMGLRLYLDDYAEAKKMHEAYKRLSVDSIDYLLESRFDSLVAAHQASGASEINNGHYDYFLQFKQYFQAYGPMLSRTTAPTQMFIDGEIELHPTESSDMTLINDLADIESQYGSLAEAVRIGVPEQAKIDAKLELNRLLATQEIKVFTERETVTVEKIRSSGLLGNVDRIGVVYGAAHRFSDDIQSNLNRPEVTVGHIDLQPKNLFVVSNP